MYHDNHHASVDFLSYFHQINSDHVSRLSMCTHRNETRSNILVIMCTLYLAHFRSVLLVPFKYTSEFGPLYNV